MRSTLHCYVALVLSLSAVGCDTSYVVAYHPVPDAGPTCAPSAPTEATCAGATDDDCDGFTDCLDPDCDGQACGGTDVCVAGACITCEPGQPCATPLPRLDNLRVHVRGDSVVVEFDPIDGALDYRIYPMPNASDVSIAPDGTQTIANAIYRCAGDRPTQDRVSHPGALLPEALIANENGYARTEGEAVLGYVFTTPAPGRLPVYRVADPNGAGGYLSAEQIAPIYAEANSAEYVTDRARRDALVASGWRNDGIAFYAPSDGDRAVYRASYEPDVFQGNRLSLFFADGPEHDARVARGGALDLSERFRVLSAQAPGSVALRRVTYRTGSTFDVLAAGDAQYARVLHQSGPVAALTWTGLTAPTVLVLEALDAGCPFPGGYISAFAAGTVTAPSITLDDARLPTGEVFVNGQHDPTNRPRPIARAYVSVAPEPPPPMDFYTSFTDASAFAGMSEATHPYAHLFRNADWAVDTFFCADGFTFGPMLGELFVGFSNCSVSVVPRTIQPRIARDRFLHVRMSVDIVSTMRRWPLILITTTPMVEEGDVASVFDVPLFNRLGPLYAAELPGTESSIIVQPHAGFHELEVQFCDQRGWGVSARCPRANIYGEHAGDFSPAWGEPWTAVPVLEDRAGFDRPVQLDVYASTERVYVLIDDEPAGCAILPPGRMPEGNVTVAFASILWEATSDDEILARPDARAYERTYSVSHSDRRLDDLGIELGAPIPPWDEGALRCGTRWYGGALLSP